jgi:hypothetical protein
MKLKFEGKFYRGTDEVLHKSVVVANGAVVEVSDKKAAQLLKDYPGQWKPVDEKAQEPEPVRATENAAPAVEPEPQKPAQHKKTGKKHKG